MSVLQTEWFSDDPKVAGLLLSIEHCRDAALRLEMEAALHSWQAAACIRDATELRALRSRRSRKNPTPV